MYAINSQSMEDFAADYAAVTSRGAEAGYTNRRFYVDLRETSGDFDVTIAATAARIITGCRKCTKDLYESVVVLLPEECGLMTMILKAVLSITNHSTPMLIYTEKHHAINMHMSSELPDWNARFVDKGNCR